MHRFQPLSRLVVALLTATTLVSCTTTATSSSEAQPVTVIDVADLESRRAPAADFAVAVTTADVGVRRAAAIALGRLERVDATDSVLAMLADPDAGVRASAAFAAGQLDLALSLSARHSALRQRVEAALILRLKAEGNDDARRAVIRALGRVAIGDGLQKLVAVAAVPGAMRAEALTALGVAGARRSAPLATDVGLIAAVTAAFADADDDVRIAAAYVVFRQQIALPKEAFQAGLAGPVQARIHLARALALKALPTPLVEELVVPLLTDPDWRVQVEALRAERSHPDTHIDPIVALLPSAAQKIAVVGQAHVVFEACTTLAAVGAASVSLTTVEQAVSALPPGPTWAFARCTCAGVVEILGGAGDALEQCTAALPVTTQRLLSIDTIASARISSIEKAAALKTLLVDDAPKVRIASASALCADGSLAAADAAATRLLKEDDSGVISALLECFAGGENADVIKDQTLVIAAGHLTERVGIEQLEPLVTIAKLARARKMRSLVDTLSVHADPTVRDAAMGIDPGDRAAGPRAQVLPWSSPATMPLAAVLRTTRGEIVIALDRERAPRTVKNFVTLAVAGTYNNTPWHRVVADFVAQGGDPRGDGSGGPGYTVPCENSDAPFVRGAVGMAHAGKDTGGSQFFLTHSDQRHLDGRYTYFGFVTDGLAVMDALQRDDVIFSVDFTTALRPRNANPEAP